MTVGMHPATAIIMVITAGAATTGTAVTVTDVTMVTGGTITAAGTGMRTVAITRPRAG